MDVVEVLGDFWGAENVISILAVRKIVVGEICAAPC
jgi:hypothetical protein